MYHHAVAPAHCGSLFFTDVLPAAWWLVSKWIPVMNTAERLTLASYASWSIRSNWTRDVSSSLRVAGQCLVH